MLEQGRSYQNIKENDIDFGLCASDMGEHEGLWKGVYKGVEVQEVKIVN